MFMNYDLAKSILDDRRADASAHSLRRLAQAKTRQLLERSDREDAEVIELTFGRHCETGQIGA